MGARSALPLSSWRRSFRMARSTGSSSFSFIRADCHRRYARQSLKGPKISGSKRCIGCKRDAWSQRIAAQARLVSLRCEANREKRSSPMAHVVSLLNDDHQEEGKLLDGQSELVPNSRSCVSCLGRCSQRRHVHPYSGNQGNRKRQPTQCKQAIKGNGPREAHKR